MSSNSMYTLNTIDSDIILKDISFSYDQNLLHQFSLSIPAGKRTALFAPSGWGKTTLLFLIAGLLKPENGEIIYPIHNPQFSMVFQENRLIENASIKHNLTLVQNQLSAPQLQKHLRAVDLNYPPAKKARHLSGGEQRRLSILRALCADYDILLLDEPFTGLDDGTKQKVITHILHETEGKTVILVTHDIEDAHALNCDIIQLTSTL